MKYVKVNIEHRTTLTHDCVTSANSVAGCVFDNDDLELSFLGINFQESLNDDFIKIRLNSIGIDATVLIKQGELNRILGTDLLDIEYVKYLLKSKISKVDFEFIEIPLDEIGATINAIISVNNIKVSILVELKTLIVDECFMQKKLTNFLRDIRLNVEITALETYLSSKEVLGLSSQDVVFVYPK